MADQKISQLNSLTGANTASGDLVTVVDISDTTMGASGTNKKMTLAEFQASPVSAGTANGVLFLNGTKVPSSGSALTFDGTRLGIGVASPTQRLELAGSIGVNTSVAPGANGSGVAIYASDFPRLSLRNATTGDTTSDGMQVYLVGADVSYNLLETGYQRWLINNAETMRLDTSGNLGIGTASPGGRLHSYAGTGIGAGHAIFGDSAIGYWNFNSGGSPSGRVIARGYDSSAVEQIRLDPSGDSFLLGGNLGIGTASPGTRLHVQAGTAATGNSAFFANQDGTNNPYLQIQHSSVGVKLFNSSSAGGSANNLIFGNGSTAETMRIDANGNVIVGTAALATTATAGFPWIPSCAGIPTGAPTAPYTNAAAMVVDTTNNRLYVRVGSTWRYATLT